MTNPAPQRSAGGDLACLRRLAHASRQLGAQPDPLEALWELIGALRGDLGLDRAGIYAYDRFDRRVEHVIGVDQIGGREVAGISFNVSDEVSPLMEVVRGERPHYLSQDAPAEYPHRQFAPGVRALAVIPIIASDELLGLLCVDNCLGGAPISPALLEPLLLYAGLAALPLFARYQRKERERTEAIRRRIHREVLSAVTVGRILLCSREEIDAEWPLACEQIPIRRELDVRAVRQAARECGLLAGMTPDRAADLGLCASEAATNALLHGRGGFAAVARREDVLRVRVTDEGSGIDPEDLPRATLLRGWSTRASMGLGFTVINETADRIYLHTGAGGTTIIIEMAREPTRPSPGSLLGLEWEEAAVPL